VSDCVVSHLSHPGKAMIVSRMSFLLAAASALTLSACEPRETAEARTVTHAPPASVLQGSAAVYRFVTAGDGNAARYRIREQLVGVDLPNDAVGETKAVTGVISADRKGNLIASESKFTVDVTNLVSDKDRRDGFVRRRVLEADKFPTVTLVPTSIKGLSLPLPASGKRSFDLTGDLTVRGVTHPTTWKVDASFTPRGMNGKAATSFTFTDFAIDQPRVPVLLSVGDTIRLELDFNLEKR
jgi:polyisoprenoid-binding protein YceI